MKTFELKHRLERMGTENEGSPGAKKRRQLFLERNKRLLNHDSKEYKAQEMKSKVLLWKTKSSIGGSIRKVRFKEISGEIHWFDWDKSMMEQ